MTFQCRQGDKSPCLRETLASLEHRLAVFSKTAHLDFPLSQRYSAFGRHEATGGEGIEMNGKPMDIVRCVSCDGYGWLSEDGEAECDWCRGIGYVYRSVAGVDQPIPPTDLPALGEKLEALEVERLREIGYSGAAKKPWEQAIRQARGKLLDGNGDTDIS
jgi:hypothetical protein